MSCATVSNRSSRVIRWCWPPQHLLRLGLLLLVEAGVLDHAVEVVVEVGIDELQGSPEQMYEQLGSQSPVSGPQLAGLRSRGPRLSLIIS